MNLRIESRRLCQVQNEFATKYLKQTAVAADINNQSAVSYRNTSNKQWLVFNYNRYLSRGHSKVRSWVDVVRLHDTLLNAYNDNNVNDTGLVDDFSYELKLHATLCDSCHRSCWQHYNILFYSRPQSTSVQHLMHKCTQI